MPLLSIEHLSVALSTARGSFKAVDDVSFSVDTGEILGIAGESGSGKTMTALTLLGLLPHGARTAGKAVFDGTDLLTMSPKKIRAVRGRQIAMVSQDPATSLHPILTVERQLTEHMRHHLGVSRSEARTRAVDLLATVRIPDPEQALTAYPGQFSGGMRQRIAIAVALACEPRLLLADEPTTALDVTVQAGILRLLQRLRTERGLAVVIITHDLGVMSALADRVCVMYGGRMAEVGPRSEILSAPRHPYTRGLLDALPHPEGGAAELRPIAGSPPSLGNVPTGCPFHPRCPHAEPGCSLDRPELVTVAPGHLLACPVDPLARPVLEKTR
ncbi:peptide/nickel transport system ATP-binding protein [Nakamurella panacisegetis]|uniref:Peptide/nickel transport system ATP-binding protein n=1 Tax=Nakamurella panacisegetis TaxID=1090615 RepID=A0A1H0MW56_9ACTN|nr:ABC transporter ATP-binding protein [Nakamurella panacisegetis]SDO84689.1 peptide/nickel transport system ATP-binding protein [Nakamurella panacisegetis]